LEKKVIIIGGGLSGLITSIELARYGIHCTVIEKNKYPFHRVCGEYVSNETLPFLKKHNLLPDIPLPQISKFNLSSVSGKSANLNLDLGGFGISRYCFDNFLFENAKSYGVNFLLGTSAEEIAIHKDKFEIKTAGNNLEADFVVGTFGKRSKIDVQLSRTFAIRRSPYMAIKYHIRTDHPENMISLHNFPGGYCGISRVEGGVTNLCYLANRDQFKEIGNIPEFERVVLCKNPLLQYIFNNSSFIFDRPLVTNEISFAAKSPVENHILMAGDAAGTIAPLCGNGMAMAIHSAKLLSEVLSQALSGPTTRQRLEVVYTKLWKKNFAKRIWFGRQLQKLFGNRLMSNVCVNLSLNFRPIASTLVKHSHGKPF
jgi:flavin-dependent dehydrogenase